MLNLKRTSTVVALATGLSVAAVSPALAEDRQESDSQQRAEIVRDVQDNADGNDLGGVGNGNHADTDTDTGDNDVDVDPHVEPRIDPEVGSGDNDVHVTPETDPQVDGSGDNDVVDDDSRTTDHRSSDDDRNGDRGRSGDEDDGLLGGLL